MHSIEFDKSIIKGVKLINVETIITHEEIIEKKASRYLKYEMARTWVRANAKKGARLKQLTEAKMIS